MGGFVAGFILCLLIISIGLKVINVYNSPSFKVGDKLTNKCREFDEPSHEILAVGKYSYYVKQYSKYEGYGGKYTIKIIDVDDEYMRSVNEI